MSSLTKIERRREAWATYYYVGDRRIEFGFVADALCADGEVRPLPFTYRRRTHQERGSHNDIDTITEDTLVARVVVFGALVDVPAEQFAVDPEALPWPAPKEERKRTMSDHACGYESYWTGIVCD